MSHAVEEHVDQSQASYAVFRHVDALAARPGHVRVDVRTQNGSAFQVSAGGPPPRAWDGPEPPFTHYAVEFAQILPIPWLPHVWQRYAGGDEGFFILVPKLLIAHLVFSDGGLARATFSLEK